MSLTEQVYTHALLLAGDVAEHVTDFPSMFFRAQFVLNYFYKNTDLQISYNFNNVGIVNQRPVQMSLMNMLDAFIDFRKDFLTNYISLNIYYYL